MPNGPDIRYGGIQDVSCLPSWSGTDRYLSDDHRAIFERTASIPGWQAEGDTHKLFEMAHHCGEVILEIGMYSGKSAVVEILGALSNGKTPAPQYFGVDVDQAALIRTKKVLQDWGLEQHTLLFLGNLGQLVEALDVTPTMVFVDGDHSYEGCAFDLRCLNDLVAEGTPILCHDWANDQNDTGEYGVTRACQDWEKAGYGEFAGRFGCSALYIRTGKEARCAGSLTALRFERLRNALHGQYTGALAQYGYK